MAENRSVVADLRAARTQSRALASSLSELFADAETAAWNRLATQPYATLAVAIGIGYVMGGGFPIRFTALLMTVGTRVAFEAAARELGARLVRPSAPTRPVRPGTSQGEERS